MVIEELISNPRFTAPTECEPYQLKIFVEGVTDYYEPVDFRLNSIHVPLETGDVEMIYNKSNKKTNCYYSDNICRMYYPPSYNLTMNDGTTLIILKYGQIKRYRGMSRVTAYCKPADETQTLITKIPNKSVLDKVLCEMNKILLSNEELKRLLPQYSYNWMLYNDETGDNKNAAAAHQVLDNIGFYEYQEMYYQQNIFKTTLENSESISTLTTNELKQFANDFVKKRYSICYNNVVKLFRMKAIATWLIHIAINIDKMIDYRYISILNKYKDYMKVTIGVDENEVLGSDIEFMLETPDDSAFNYRIRLDQVVRHTDDYISYDIGEIRLYQINKTTLEEKLLENASMQVDNFLSFVRVLEILSADVDNRIMHDYYNDIENMIAEMDISKDIVMEDHIDIPNDESIEQKVIRYVNNTVDEKTLPRVQEILAKYVLEGSLTIDENGVIESIQDGGSSAF